MTPVDRPGRSTRTREERHDEILRWSELQHARRRRRSREQAVLTRLTRG